MPLLIRHLLDPERIAAISRWFERSEHHRNSMTDAFPDPGRVAAFAVEEIPKTL